MKANIDLTDGRDFPDRARIPIDIFSRTILKHVGIPWNLKFITSDFELDISENRLFPTGTRDQIRLRRTTEHACDGQHCDRCGASLKIIPWKNLFGLCTKCDSQLTAEFGKRKIIPWGSR